MMAIVPSNKDQLRSINNNNSFVMILRQRILVFSANSLGLIKRLIRNGIILVLINGITLYFKIDMWIFTVLSVLLYGFTTLYSWGIIKHSHSMKFYDMVYSEAFNSVYVNEEDISKYTQNVNIDIGKIESIEEKIGFDNVVLVVIYAILILLRI